MEAQRSTGTEMYHERKLLNAIQTGIRQTVPTFFTFNWYEFYVTIYAQNTTSLKLEQNTMVRNVSCVIHSCNSKHSYRKSPPTPLKWIEMPIICALFRCHKLFSVEDDVMYACDKRYVVCLQVLLCHLCSSSHCLKG